MFGVGGAVDLAGLALAVVRILVGQAEDGERLVPLGVIEGHVGADLQGRGLVLRNAQGDGDRPRLAAGQVHRADDGVELALRHEALKRAEHADRQRLQVAPLAALQADARKAFGPRGRLGGLLLAQQAVDEHSAVRSDRPGNFSSHVETPLQPVRTRKTRHSKWSV
jgi:hypothetical protein